MATRPIPLLITLFYGIGILALEPSLHAQRNMQGLSSDSSNQPYRTAYHFQPPKNWMNDPNGSFGGELWGGGWRVRSNPWCRSVIASSPTDSSACMPFSAGAMMYKGIYHLFYQYNPKSAAWGHSVSKDLVNWISLDPAIHSSQLSGINGCWSGSATVLPGGKPAILYRGIGRNNHQLQNLAFPKDFSDPFLREWVMASTVANKINSTSLRDPNTAWLGKDGYWRVLVGSNTNTTGMAILYKSKDLAKWAQAKQPLHLAQGTGMWECPDFYPISNKSPFLSGVDTSVNGNDVRHVLKGSLDDKKHDYYLIGTYDTANDIFIPDNRDSQSVLRYDYGKYYASKTVFDDGKNGRILWGWVDESSSVADNIKRGWPGVYTIPRAIWLHKSGNQLMQWPVPKIESLRVNPVNWPTKVLKGGELLQINGITAAQADVEISFEVNKFGEAEVLDNLTDPQILCGRKGGAVKGGLGPFGLLVLVSEDLQEYTTVSFRMFRHRNKNVVLMCSDQSRSSLNKGNDMTPYGTYVDVDPLHEKLSLRTMIDHSVVESFGGEGKACITSRVYPILAINDKAQLYAFNNGTAYVKITRMSAWSMKKAKIN